MNSEMKNKKMRYTAIALMIGIGYCLGVVSHILFHGGSDGVLYLIISVLVVGMLALVNHNQADLERITVLRIDLARDKKKIKAMNDDMLKRMAIKDEFNSRSV